jgi:hypothetical protein
MTDPRRRLAPGRSHERRAYASLRFRRPAGLRRPQDPRGYDATRAMTTSGAPPCAPVQSGTGATHRRDSSSSCPTRGSTRIHAGQSPPRRPPARPRRGPLLWAHVHLDAHPIRPASRRSVRIDAMLTLEGWRFLWLEPSRARGLLEAVSVPPREISPSLPPTGLQRAARGPRSGAPNTWYQHTGARRILLCRFGHRHQHRMPTIVAPTVVSVTMHTLQSASRPFYNSSSRVDMTLQVPATSSAIWA